MSYEEFQRQVAEIQAEAPPADPLTDEQIEQWLSEADYANQFEGT